jgi:hypothetical protein
MKTNGYKEKALEINLQKWVKYRTDILGIWCYNQALIRTLCARRRAWMEFTALVSDWKQKISLIRNACGVSFDWLLSYTSQNSISFGVVCHSNISLKLFQLILIPSVFDWVVLESWYLKNTFILMKVIIKTHCRKNWFVC